MKTNPTNQPDGPEDRRISDKARALQQLELDEDHEEQKEKEDFFGAPYFGPDNLEVPPAFGNLTTKEWDEFCGRTPTGKPHWPKQVKLKMMQRPGITEEELKRGWKPPLKLIGVGFTRVELLTLAELSSRPIPPARLRDRLRVKIFDFENCDDPEQGSYLVARLEARSLPFLERGLYLAALGGKIKGASPDRRFPFWRKGPAVGIPMENALRMFGREKHLYLQIHALIAHYENAIQPPPLEPKEQRLDPFTRLKAQFVQAALTGCLASQEEATPMSDDDVLVERALSIGELAFTRFCEENSSAIKRFNEKLGL